MCECRKTVYLDGEKEYGNVEDADAAEVSVGTRFFASNLGFEKFSALNIEFSSEQEERGYLFFKINYCPFCGEKLLSF